jgi:NADPH:quinone reductase-like Zn-dependent oxidoreductase
MRQIWISRAGPPEVLELREAPDPDPGQGEVRIRVEAAGINFADVLGRLGLYPDLPPMPCVPGYEVAGRVDAIGKGVDESWLGADVLALTRFGGYSDTVCVPALAAFRRPEGMSAAHGASIPVNYLTAWQLLFPQGGLQAGETVLVHSAGGGVGIAVIQLAKLRGATVIGTASAWKHDRLRELGADHLIDYTREDFVQRTLEVTGGRGVEVALDAVGGRSFAKSYQCLSATGRLGMFGISTSVGGKKKKLTDMLRLLGTMPWLKFNPLALMNENKGVYGVNLGHMWGERERVAAWADELLSLYAQGKFRPVVSEVFPFEQAAAAHHFIHDRRNLGKVLLTTEPVGSLPPGAERPLGEIGKGS